MKEFSKLEIASIKRTAQNVNKYVSQKEKLEGKKAAIDAEIVTLQGMIDAWQEPIKKMTGGFTTEDLIIKTVDKSGEKGTVSTKYELRYPETVIPSPEVLPSPEVSAPANEPVNMHAPVETQEEATFVPVDNAEPISPFSV